MVYKRVIWSLSTNFNSPTMGSIKFALVALLAFSAVQCQCASVPEPVPEDLDLFLAAQQAIKIVRNVIGAVEKGIQDSKPSIDILVQQLTPEVGKAVRKVIDDALDLVKKERERIEFMIKEVEDLLNAVKKIKSCTDPEKKNIEKLLANLENGILAGVRAAIKGKQEELDDLKTGFRRILTQARKLFDTEIAAVMACIKPGNPNAQKCLKDEYEKIKKGVLGLASNIFLFYAEVSDVLPNFALDVVGKVQPSIDAFKKDGEPIMKKVSDCIAKLK